MAAMILNQIKKSLFMILATLLTACQLIAQPTPPPATVTPQPTATPTITPTPAPQQMKIEEMQQDCEELDEGNTTVILEGPVYLPEGEVYGYVGWYGMNLISTSRLRILFAIGSGPNQMEELPFDFRQPDMRVHTFDERLVRDGHMVRVTGRPKYRADSEERRCELWVDQVESLMPPEMEIPLEPEISKIRCPFKEPSKQLIRVTGSLSVLYEEFACWMNECRVKLANETGVITTVFVVGDRANRMAPLPTNYTNSDLVIFDRDGNLVDSGNVSVIGIVRRVQIAERNAECQLIVYEVEPGTTE